MMGVFVPQKWANATNQAGCSTFTSATLNRDEQKVKHETT
jgi:hypothetical protein